MNWRWHLTIGFFISTIFLILNYLYNWMQIDNPILFYILSAGVIMFYSLAPDLDHQISKLRLITTVLGLFIILFLGLSQQTLKMTIATGILIVLWILPLIKGFGHRGHYHSIIFGLLLAFPLIFIEWELAVVGFIAFLSHLMADICIKLW